ncbi:MAG: aminotransferase class I/II-fold pyridoxal phosphate-dependent enzyme, partial [Clostridia bacterium]|nr:aminotransferase class I/II-fold pyridoxal phosphate-dependent enzyme [Clostridia bacterium]
LRLGFAVAPAKLTGYLRAAKSPYNVNALTQAAGAAVLGEQGWLRETAAKTVALKNSLEESLGEIQAQHPRAIHVFETHTNFTLVRSAKAARIAAMLFDAGISVRFLPENLLRITSGTQAENKALIAALDKILKGGVH